MDSFNSSSSYLRQTLFNGHQPNSYQPMSSESLIHFRRPMPVRRPAVPSSYMAEGLQLPPVNNRLYQESRYKTELCRQFEELGECEYGNRCLFAHGFADLRALPNRHPKFKTERCSAFHEYGFCAFGPRCSFIHEKKDPIQLLSEIARTIPEEVLTRVQNNWETDSCDSIGRHFSSDSVTDSSDAMTDRSESPTSWLWTDSDFEGASSSLLPEYNFDGFALDFFALGGYDITPPISPSWTRLPVFERICPSNP